MEGPESKDRCPYRDRRDEKEGTEIRVMQLQAKEHPSPQKLEEARKHCPLDPSEGERPCHQLILDIWPPELEENTFLLSEAAQLVGIRYGSSRN